VLTALFATRVAGQAIQRWMPQGFLPQVGAFQGSNLPYWLLLSSQLVILALMVRVCLRMQRRTLVRTPRAGLVLAWLGGIYMALALGRIAAGLAIPDAHAWFRAWIPAFFHIVLAAFVLAVSLYHRSRAAS
jgi:hypothetical protein